MVWMVGMTEPPNFCYPPLHPHSVCVNQPKHLLLVEVITTNNCVNRMTRLEGNAGKCAGGRCGSGQSTRRFCSINVTIYNKRHSQHH